MTSSWNRSEGERNVAVVVGALGVLAACSSLYYSALEKVGLEKRYEALWGEYDESRRQADPGPRATLASLLASQPSRTVPRSPEGSSRSLSRRQTSFTSPGV